MNIARLLLAIFLIILNYYHITASDSSRVITYYLRPGYDGAATTLRMEIGICYNLIDHYNNNRMKSIKPGICCVDLFKGANCRRAFLRVAPGKTIFRLCILFFFF